jgi:hypothetical protein
LIGIPPLLAFYLTFVIYKKAKSWTSTSLVTPCIF